MKPSEIILISLLVIVGFLMADFLVNRLVLQGAFQRFVLRVGLQVQFYALIYFFFETRECSRRANELENNLSIGNGSNSQTDMEKS